MGKSKKSALPDLGDLAQDGAEIAVKVNLKAARNALQVVDGCLRILVTAPPENGKANDAVQTILATATGVAKSRLILKRGQTSRNKLFLYSASSRN